MTYTLSFDDMIETVEMLAYLRADTARTIQECGESHPENRYAQELSAIAQKRLATLDRLLAVYRAL